MPIFAKNVDYMIYKKNAKQPFDEERVTFSLIAEFGTKKISAIVRDGEDKLASIVSVIHNLDVLDDGRNYEILLVESINSIDIMFRLQKFFYENLHKLGIRYFWFETKNQKLIELAEKLYALYKIEGTDYYYVDLNKMYYHNNGQPNQ